MAIAELISAGGAAASFVVLAVVSAVLNVPYAVTMPAVVKILLLLVVKLCRSENAV